MQDEILGSKVPCILERCNFLSSISANIKKKDEEKMTKC